MIMHTCIYIHLFQLDLFGLCTLWPSTLQCLPQKEIATGCHGGPDDSLSSVLLYIHVLYEGKDVRVYRILLFCSIILLAKELLAAITMIIQLFKIYC